MSAHTGRIKVRSMIFAPMMLPAESEPCFFAMAVSVVTSSGRDVPMAMMVTEMTRSETPHMEASAEPLSTRSCAPAPVPPAPMRNLTTLVMTAFFVTGSSSC